MLIKFIKSNKCLINLARKMWHWGWLFLMDGFAPSDEHGNYKRPRGLYFNKGLEINLSKYSNIYLLVGTTCPWCHKTILVHKLKNLADTVTLIVLKPDISNGQWVFEKKFYGISSLKELYQKSKRKIQFRETVPVLISYENKKINLITNESTEIVHLLNSINSTQNEKAINFVIRIASLLIF